jgi:SAM-dependent methyltransferase
VKDPQRAVAEIYRVLKKEGVVLATLPFMQPYHPDPTDCQRFTREGVQRLFKSFETVKLSNNRGACAMFSWVLRDFLAIFLSFNNLTLWKAWNVALGWLLYPVNYLDYLLPEHSQLHVIAASFLYVGRKRG